VSTLRYPKLTICRMAGKPTHRPVFPKENELERQHGFRRREPSPQLNWSTRLLAIRHRFDNHLQMVIRIGLQVVKAPISGFIRTSSEDDVLTDQESTETGAVPGHPARADLWTTYQVPMRCRDSFRYVRANS
jgi:hypothetical protein